MCPISADDMDHYTVVYGLNSRKLRESVVGHWSVHWGSMEGFFRDIHAFGVGYKRAKGYKRAEFNSLEASIIYEVKSTKHPALCFRCCVPYFKNTCTKYTDQSKKRSQSLSSTRQNYKRIDNPQNFHNNGNNNNIFPTGTLSFHISQQIKPDDNISSSINTIKHFLRK